MKNIVRELVELGVKIGFYKKTFNSKAPKFLLNNWMEMFIKGLPLSNPLDNTLGLLLDPKYVEDNSPYSDDALKTQSILNHNDVLQYLKLTGSWSENVLGLEKDFLPNFTRVLGFLVYDVFTSLCSLPASLVNMNNVSLGPVLGVLDFKIEDSSRYQLCNELFKRNILSVFPEVAVEYCLTAYHQKTDTKELIQMLEDGKDIISNTNGNYLLF